MIFFGKGGEVASNRLDDQEVSVHALHLPQSCLVYGNTLMLQQVLAEPGWMARMTSADIRGLTPLVWGHVSPYGTFDLDLIQDYLGHRDSRHTVHYTRTAARRFEGLWR